MDAVFRAPNAEAQPTPASAASATSERLAGAPRLPAFEVNYHLLGDDGMTECRNDWTTASKRSGWSY